MLRLFALVVLLLPAVAQAATLNVCVRNDGVGTFAGYDFDVHADCTPNSGDRSEP